MWPYHEELLRKPVPRYTSYPTAAEFGENVGVTEHARALASIEPASEVSLYVHIPFCDEICWYCGCNTARSNRPARLSAYLEALHNEIDLVAAALPHPVKVSRISFGGGSPNALKAVDFARIIDRLTIAFMAPEPLISVELDPRHFTLDWLRTVAAIGVRNISLGVQTFDPKVQAAIGRVQPYDIVAELVEELRLAGVRSINFDLMYGLPGQDEAVLKDTIERTVGLMPERIALFGYAHLPSLLPRQRRIDATRLPDVRERFDLASLGHDLLTSAGYEPIGFDHFALPDDPIARAAREKQLHRNFQGFTDDSAKILIGMGASAISHLPGLYVQNAKNSGAYREAIASGRLATEKGVALTETDLETAALIEDILCNGHADIGGHISPAQAGYMAQLQSLGLIQIKRKQLELTKKAIPYARAIAAAFDTYRPMTSGVFSSAI